MKGLDPARCIVGSTAITSSFTAVTMGTNSVISDMGVMGISNTHNLIKGIQFNGTTVTNSKVNNCNITVDNSAAGTGGSSNVYGVIFEGTGISTRRLNNLSNCNITVSSVGFGNKRGVYVGSFTSPTIYQSDIFCGPAAGASAPGTFTGVQSVTGASCNLSHSTVNGFTNDILAFTGSTMNLECTQLENFSAGGLGFLASPSDDIYNFAAGALPSAIRYMFYGTLSNVQHKFFMKKPCILKSFNITFGTPSTGSETFIIYKNGVAIYNFLTSNVASFEPPLSWGGIRFLRGDYLMISVEGTPFVPSQNVSSTVSLYT